MLGKEQVSKNYHCEFNWKGEIYNADFEAYSEDHAFRKMCWSISKRLGLTNDIDIRHYFWGTDKFNIKEIKQDVKELSNKEAN
jgi:hypothetical protein